MNINRFLCKHFGVDKKRYVTIEDFSRVVYIYMVLGAAVLFCIYILIQGVLFALSGRIYNPQEQDVLGVFGIILWIILIIIAVLAGWVIIKDVRIAKCELKNKEE